MVANAVNINARPALKIKSTRASGAKPTSVHAQRSKRVALPTTIAIGCATIANEAHAQEAIRSIEVQVVQLADVPTPLLYFGFLTTSLTFAVGTYLALTKIKLI